MNLSELLNEAIIWLTRLGIVLCLGTLVSFLFNFGLKFRLVGTTIFTLLLAGSCWAFSKSYLPPTSINGAIYTPIVFDDGYGLVVGQAGDEFPIEAIEPSLNQIASNLKGGGRNGSKVTIRIRKVIPVREGLSKPKIIGEAIRDTNKEVTTITNKIENYSTIEETRIDEENQY